MYEKEQTPGEPFDIGLGGWAADYLDPQDVLNYQFESRFRGPDGFNKARFSDPTWDRRLQAAARLSGQVRFRTYGKLDVELARDEAPAAAFEVSTRGQFFSARIGCEINQPAYYTVDLAALCLRR